MVANLESFSELDEYRSPGGADANTEAREALAPPEPSSAFPRHDNVIVDPKTVILGVFEDDLPAGPSATQPASDAVPPNPQFATPSAPAAPTAPMVQPSTAPFASQSSRGSSATSHASGSPIPHMAHRASFASAGSRHTSVGASGASPLSPLSTSSSRRLPPLATNLAAAAGRAHSATPTPTTATAGPAFDYSDAALVHHYRTCIRAHLVQVRHSSPRASTGAAEVPDGFEQQAVSYPPVS